MTSPNLQPVDFVLMREDNTAPLPWPTALIIDIHPGKEGIFRVFTIRTPKGIFERPIIKICHLTRVILNYSVIVSRGGSLLR